MSQKRLPNYILVRGGTFYVRMAVPLEAREILGKTELKRSLNTKNSAEAALLAPPAIASFQRQIIEAQAQCTPGHKVVSEIALHDAKEFVRAQLENMQGPPDRLRARGLHLRRGQMGDDRSTRLAANLELLRFFEEVQTDPSWDGWRVAMGRSSVSAYEAKHGVTIDPQSTAHDHLSEFGAQAQIEHVRRAIHRDRHPFEAAPAPDSGIAFGGVATGLTIDQLLKAYREDREQTWKPASGDAFRKVERVLRDWFGVDRGVADISRDEFRALFRAIPRLPRSYSQSGIFKGLPIREVINRADGMSPSPVRLSEKTYRDYIIHIQSVLKWAAAEEYIPKNPAERIPLSRSTRITVPRGKFSSSDLTLLFTTGLYAAGTNARERDASFWLPLIALFTGMRSGEIAQLRPVDIAIVDEIMCIRLTNPDDLKTEMSVRDIPIHSELFRLGFVEFVQGRLGDGSTRLFPELPFNAKKDQSSQFSKIFRKMLASAGLAERGLCMHSFRHTMTAALVANRTPPSIAEAILGWGKKVRTMYQHYGGRPPLRQLADAVNSIRHEGLNLRHLYPCNTDQAATPRRQFD